MREYANLVNADLSGAKIWDADLYGANFQGADLSGADLFYSDLRNGDFFEITSCPEDTILVSNLPYGKRIKKDSDFFQIIFR